MCKPMAEPALFHTHRRTLREQPNVSVLNDGKAFIMWHEVGQRTDA